MEVRYTELANDLVKQIKEGTLPVGTRLPSELALAQQYEVSRTTLRSALDIVERLGLIARKRRAGTVVLARETTPHYTKSLHTIDDLVNYASYTDRTVMGTESVVCDAPLAASLGCRPGQPWIKVSMLRCEQHGERQPVCWTDAYLDPQIGEDVLAMIPDGPGLICHLIEAQTGRTLKDLKQEIGATTLSPDIAAHLQAAPHATGLEITRQYYDAAKQAFLVTVSTYPADKFKFVFWMHRNNAGDARRD